MATIKTNNTQVGVSRTQMVTRKEKSILFGLIKWWVVVKAQKISDDLIIETDLNIDKIYLNGKELTAHNV